MNRATWGVFLIALVGMLEIGLWVVPAQGVGNVYIRPDGSIEPPDAPIITLDNITYTFIGNFSDSTLIVLKNNITIDGKGYAITGTGPTGREKGIDIAGISNVTVENLNIASYVYGIAVGNSNHTTILRNNITGSSFGIVVGGSSNCSFSGNYLANPGHGIRLDSSNYNSISGNRMDNGIADVIIATSSSYNRVSRNSIKSPNSYGIILDSSSANIISENTIENNYYGVKLTSCLNNTLYHNNFQANIQHVLSIGSMNAWDNGYPSGGNYWDTYTGTDNNRGPYQNITGRDFIGDTPYTIGANNIDNYPLMQRQPPFLTIEPSGNGTTYPEPGTHAYEFPAIAQVWAVPYYGYHLDHWELDDIDVGAESPINIAMNTNCTLRGVFKPNNYTLDIEIYYEEGGTTNPISGTYSFEYLTVLNVTATASSGNVFYFWIFNIYQVSYDNTITIGMWRDTWLVAVFGPKQTGGGLKGSNLLLK